MRENAGRPGVQYELDRTAMRLYYAPQTQAVIGQKTQEGMKMEVHTIGPPDGVMARIALVQDAEGAPEFYLDRECVPVLDEGGPWIRESRNLGELNHYLCLFGLEAEVADGSIKLRNIEPKEPQDLCDHEPDWYIARVEEHEYDSKLGRYKIFLSVPCVHCGIRAKVSVVEPDLVWKEDNEE